MFSILLALTLVIKSSFANIPATFDATSTESGRNIGWIQILSCTEGGPQTPGQLSTFTYPNGDVATLGNNYFADAIALQILRDDKTPADMDFTNNADRDNLAVMTQICSNPVLALNRQQEVSYVIDTNTGLPVGVADMSNWLGSTEAKSRLPQNDECTCTLETSQRSFSSIIYHSCCSHDGLHLNTVNMCYWDWMGPHDIYVGEWEGSGISVWVGFDVDGTYKCHDPCDSNMLGEDCSSDASICPDCMRCCLKNEVCEWPQPAAESILNKINNMNEDMNGVSGVYEYPMYSYILLVGAILFVLINNLFIGYYCVCKNNNTNAQREQYEKCDIVVDE